MKREITIGLAVVAGAAVLEMALVPGLILGGVAWLAPRLLSGRRGEASRQQILPPVESHRKSARGVSAEPSRLLAKSQFGRAIAKTITFRVIVTTLDFTTNYIVIGEIATAAGLSTFNLIAGPLFYFTHEAVWNYLGPVEGSGGLRLQLPGSNVDDDRATGLTISPALAKTITYRTIATVVDFTTNYLVVGSAAEAMILSATGFVLGPFVYYGHERAWEYLAGEPPMNLAPAKEMALLPAPG